MKMRILSIHSRYQIRGGEEEVYEAEINLLREKGHLVDVYEECNERIAKFNKLHLAIKTIWSEEAYQIISDRLREESYDVVHVQNFFPLISPSVYYAAKDKGVPVVQTLHNYRLLCPNALFFRNGSICEDCLGKAIPLPGLWHGCYRGSRAASGATVAMVSIHRALQTWSKLVDKYIVLTEFARQKFIQGGLPPDKIVVKPNFVACDPQVGLGKGGYFLYVGRLSVEKGLDVLLSAWELLPNNIPLKIVGDGPLSEQVKEATKKLPQIEWLGRKPIEEVYNLMGEAIAVIIPSKWYETFGRVAIESFATGTPVIAANLGAIAELVDSERTGIHFRPSAPEDLATKVKWLSKHPTKLTLMRQQARAEFESKYTAEINYQQLLKIYACLC
jgi:glycosyltransferase involved in cell wall biosynthesis